MSRMSFLKFFHRCKVMHFSCVVEHVFLRMRSNLLLDLWYLLSHLYWVKLMFVSFYFCHVFETIVLESLKEEHRQMNKWLLKWLMEKISCRKNNDRQLKEKKKSQRFVFRFVFTRTRRNHQEKISRITDRNISKWNNDWEKIKD